MKKFAENFEEYLLILILPLICLLVFANAVGRFTRGFSLPWADEAARYLMIWLVFLGISAAAKKNAHFAVRVVFMVVPARFHQSLRRLILAVTLGFSAALIFLGAWYAAGLKAMGQTTPALGLPMWIMYAAIPVGFFLLAVRSVQAFLRRAEEDRSC